MEKLLERQVKMLTNQAERLAEKENEGKGSMKFYRVPLKRFETMSESLGENPFAAFHSLDEEDDFGHQIGKKGGSMLQAMLNGKRNKRKSGLE